MKQLVELYRFRSLLANLVASELKLRYRRSVLGFLWSLLNPLLMMTIISLVFSTVMRFNIEDYAVLLLAGLLPWTFFAQSVNLALMSVVGKGALLRKVYIPKSIIPLSAVLATLVNFLLSFVPFLCLVALFKGGLSVNVLFLPCSILLLTLFTAGLAFLFACLNVFFRDFGHMTDVLLQALFYASPIIYTLEMVPDQYRAFFKWNPVQYLIECFRAPLFYGTLPSVETVTVASLSAVSVCAIGFVVFARLERQFIFKV